VVLIFILVPLVSVMIWYKVHLYLCSWLKVRYAYPGTLFWMLKITSSLRPAFTRMLETKRATMISSALQTLPAARAQAPFCGRSISTARVFLVCSNPVGKICWRLIRWSRANFILQVNRFPMQSRTVWRGGYWKVARRWCRFIRALWLSLHPKFLSQVCLDRFGA